MKALSILSLLVILAAACGTEQERYLQVGYSAQTSPTDPNIVKITFQEEDSIQTAIDVDQKIATCHSYADKYQKDNKLTIDKDTLKLSSGDLEKECARRNEFKECKDIRYVYTFHCEYQITGRTKKN